jgi:hypothetical protein
MPNPVLVFFNKSRIVDSWQYSGPLPTGWTEDLKQKNPQETSEKFIVIVLPDDSRNISDLKHVNKSINDPILIVAHGGADMNGVSWKPQENEIVKKWGSPVIIEKFTHQENNESFSRIKNLLLGALSPVDFIKNYSLQADLSLLSNLAAICQIKLLDMDANVDAELDEVLGKAPDHMHETIRQFNSAVDKSTGEEDWLKRLRIVREYAMLQTNQRGAFS